MIDANANVPEVMQRAAQDAQNALDDLLAHGREFRGVVIKARIAGDESEAVWARADGLGGFAGGHYDDFEAGIENSDATVN